MKDDFWAKLDAYLFRVLGLFLGLGGCLGVLLNNPWEKVIHSVYGITILLIFGAMAGYSILSFIHGDQEHHK